MGSKSRSSSSQNTSNSNFSIGLGGDNNGLLIGGDGNHITTTDHGAIGGALDVVKESIFSTQSGFETMSHSLENVASEAFLTVSNANDGANQLSEIALNTAENAMYANKDVSEFAMMTVSESQETIANLAGEFGGNVTHLAETSMNNNAALVSQFSSDLNQTYNNFGSDLAAVTDNALQSNAELTRELGGVMADMSTQGNQTLLQMTETQERGLDAALQVAGNMSMNDNAESSVEMIKYLSIGLAVVGAAMVFKS